MSASPGDILQLIRQGAMTRAQIQETTGLSRVTVAQRVDTLLQHGLIRESGPGRSTGGRKPAELKFDNQHAALLLATIDTPHTRIGVTGLTGNVLSEQGLEL